MTPKQNFASIQKAQNEARYKQGRYALLVILIISLINLFSIAFANTYFLFSTYVSQIIAINGALLYLETNEILYLIVTFILAFLSISPYIFLFFFSKKRVGCLIAGLLLFGIDSVLFLFDFVLLALNGDFSMLLDLVIRAYALYLLGSAVYYGLKAKKQAATEATFEETVKEGEESNSAASEFDGISRTLTISRKKAFTGMIAELIAYVDDVEVGRLKNGQTVSVTVNGGAHTLTVAASNGLLGTDTVSLAEGTQSMSYAVAIKMGFTNGKIVLSPDA